MQDRRAFTKAERHRLIASAVTRKRIGSQFELIDALAAAGCHVTQATASRDIRELGVEKTRDSLGRPRYALPDRGRRGDPRDALAAILGQFGKRATAAQNIVVLHCELGTAPAIGRALDEVEHSNVVGTLAGDDTIFVVPDRGTSPRRLAAQLAKRFAAPGRGTLA